MPPACIEHVTRIVAYIHIAHGSGKAGSRIAASVMEAVSRAAFLCHEGTQRLQETASSAMKAKHRTAARSQGAHLDG